MQPKPGAMGPYAFRENQWVGYDDVDIVKQKVMYEINEYVLGNKLMLCLKTYIFNYRILSF